MTTYYVSTAGSDSNNGLGPDASHATNKPFLTAGKVFASGSPVVAGDTVYFGPGTFYQGASITLISSIASAASPTAWRGDPKNAQGFKDGSGVLLAPALSRITTRGSSEQDTNPAASGNLLIANTNGTSGVQLYDLVLEAHPQTGNVIQLAVTSTNCRSWLVQDCRLIGFAAVLLQTGIPTAALNLTLRRCLCLTANALAATINSAAATADADLAILFESCLILGAANSSMSLSASGGNLAGGVRWKGCTMFNPGRHSAGVIQTTALRVSTVTPCRIERCLIVGGAPIVAGTSGQIVSDGYNRFVDFGGASSNFTPGTGDITDGQLDIILPDLAKWGDIPRAEMIGWTAAAPSAVRHSNGTSTVADFRGRTVAPWAGGPAIGCFEASEMAVNTGTYLTGSVTSGRITGAGEKSRWVYLPAGSWKISVVTKSGSYGGTNYPQLIVESNPSVGVAQTTATATDATEQTLTTSTLVLTAAAFLEVRLVSRSSSGSSTTDFGTLSRVRV